METIIAMQNPKAIITSNALILRLEIFLTALVVTPNLLTFQFSRKKTAKKRELKVRERVCALARTISVVRKFVILLLFVVVFSLSGCRILLRNQEY
jgi:p-aminobenzoyl-glutamate transporter AbgT